MRTPEEEARVADQGLCMRYRVRNWRAVKDSDQHPGHPSLTSCTQAMPMTFAAQERRKRERGEDADEDELCQAQSLSAKRRALEVEISDAMITDSCNAPVFV